MISEASEELLDLYSRQRFKAAVEYVQGQAIWNIGCAIAPSDGPSAQRERAAADANNRHASRYLCRVEFFLVRPAGCSSRVMEKEVGLRLREV